MQGVGASKVSLSTITSEELWRQSGRLEGKDSELFHFQDRKDAKFLLSPTHEEEITSLVKNSVQSYKDLPVRLYQISRKYRDEQRPRQGLLRGREFLMKDLYTFDTTSDAALATYEEVRGAYDKLFHDINVPFVTAAADSGSMGGKLSHEYHLPSPAGEDHVIQCQSCKDAMNKEVAIIRVSESDRTSITDVQEIESWFTISRDRKTLVEVRIPKHFTNKQRSGVNLVNTFAVKAALPELELDTGTENPQAIWNSGSGNDRIILHDPRVAPGSEGGSSAVIREASVDGHKVALTSVQPGDTCSKCGEGHVEVITAIEVGHTFNLGTRYSKPFGLHVRTHDNKLVDVQMGCHGIGVSRLIAAIAAVKADDKGLNWPTAIAPFSIVVIPLKGSEKLAEQAAREIIGMHAWYTAEKFPLRNWPDVALDDRDKPFGWKLKDADLIGYPLVVIVGPAYEQEQLVEIQSRQLGINKKNVRCSWARALDWMSALEGDSDPKDLAEAD
ncbi:proline--tRNA ligase [Elsinoe australis]|uniref:proline--tRNA ligase n=1 Tax=Elsinoe australis TaxID=40998 RepID=A0A4U7AZJ4_9PEZI|nr:proline--tRNA ligase [Elsinoe australis]